MSVTPYQQLELEWKRVHALRGALSLLRWDAVVMMPRGSAALRGEQLAALETECHGVLTSPKVSRLLERAAAGAAALEPWQAANLREMRRQRDHAFAVPVSLLTRLARATVQAEGRWHAARQQGGFAAFAPALAEVLALVRDKGALLGQALGLDPYDALIGEHTPGITSVEVDGLMKAYGRRLPSLVREAMAAQQARPPLPLEGKFTAGRQRAFVTEILRATGFSFERGRLDEASHAFTEGVPGDVRITMNLQPRDPFAGLLGALHEAGRALYAQGLPADWLDQPVGQPRGLAIESSQSLLMEMVVGRSAPFVRYIKPLLERQFGVSGDAWTEDNLLRQLIRVRRGAVRVEADELTYPLHLIVRIDIERRLLAGQLAVGELPEAWNALMQQRLGVTPAHDLEGALQDAHWASGAFGHFPLYLAGAALAAQLAESLRRDRPELDAEIARGDFSGLVGWLRDAVHAQGSRLTAQELIVEVTGRPLSATAALRHLESRYLEAA